MSKRVDELVRELMRSEVTIHFLRDQIEALMSEITDLRVEVKMLKSQLQSR